MVATKPTQTLTSKVDPIAAKGTGLQPAKGTGMNADPAPTLAPAPAGKTPAGNAPGTTTTGETWFQANRFYITGGIFIMVFLFALFVIARRRKRARAAARQKLLDREGSDPAIHRQSSKSNVYKKAVLRAGDDRATEKDLERGSSSNASPRQSVSDEVIYNIVIMSWYEHLIRHGKTEYLRTIVSKSQGMTLRDLIPEMRILANSIPNVPLERWSALGNEDKETIKEAALNLKPRIMASVGRRFRMD
jgi:hypothetical protein